MAIITKPVGGVLKGLPATFILNKSQVLALSIVSNDEYFSDSNNWKKIILKYESSEGKQQELVRFDATLASPTGFFFVSEKARNLFEIKSLKIVDFDGDVLVIPRSALTVVDFDVDFAAIPSSEIAFDGRTSASYISFPETGGVTRLLPAQNEPSFSRFWYSQGITGDFTFTATIKAGNIGENPSQALFGLNDAIPPANGYALKQGGWGINFYDAGIVAPWDVSSTSTSWSRGSTYEFEMKRVSGVVSFKINTTTFSYTLNTSATVYIVGCLQVGSWEVTNASLVIPEAPSVQSVTWDIANKTGVGSVTTGANGLITRSDAGGGYNLNILSNEIITGDGYVEFIVPADFVSVVFGLAEANSPTGSFNNLLIGCYRTANPGALEGVITTGNLTVNYGNFLNIGTVQANDVIKIERVGTTYSIKINNGSPYSVTINNTNPVKVSVSPYYSNTGVNNVTISV